MQAGRLRSPQQDKGGFYLKETSSLGLNLQIYVDKFSFLQMEDKSQSAAKKKPKKKTNKRAKQIINCMKLHFALKHDRKRKEQARHSTLLHTVSGFSPFLLLTFVQNLASFFFFKVSPFLTFPSSRCVSQSCLFNKHAVQFLLLLLLLWFLNQLKV